jgi:CDGSH-type Zn-finger protein/uncharacterized Fe-S cluster protein YjdI
MSDHEEVRGRQAVIRFDAGRCIHSRRCVLSRPDVFVPNVQGEWIHPDAATVEAIAEIAHNCPSGAITYERLDGGASESPPMVNFVEVRENGPLAFRAVLSVDGTEVGYRVTLCRCGASKSKPFCDTSHRAVGFSATGEPAVQPSDPLAVRDGPLAITPLKDGPLKAVGNLEIVSGTGATVNRTTEAFLCRCGGSGKKPYCDGTHRKIGFSAH